MTSALHYLDLTELSRRIHAREISPVEAEVDPDRETTGAVF